MIEYDETTRKWIDKRKLAVTLPSEPNKDEGVVLTQDFVDYLDTRSLRVENHALDAFRFLIQSRVDRLPYYLNPTDFHKSFRVIGAFDEKGLDKVAWYLLSICIDDFAEIVEEWGRLLKHSLVDKNNN
jgi:hypothetical protein